MSATQPPANDILASFLPGLLIQRLRRHPSLSPAAEQHFGAVLFADISGFTALTERLAERGEEGAELVGRILNDYFGTLVDIIADHGGDVLQFAGDAVTALWLPPEPHALPTACTQAARCALDIQSRLRNWRSIDGAGLALRVACAAGKVWAAQLGGRENRWEFLVTGAPLHTLSQAVQVCGPGEVLVTDDVGRMLPHGSQLTPRADGYRRLLDLPAGTPLIAAASALPLPPQARQFVPRAVVQRLEAGLADWMAEFRRLTVLFVKLEGLNYDAPDLLLRLQQATQALQATIYKHGGGINQLAMDEKGVTLIAGWGIPGKAHHDDAARAVETALAIRAELQGQRLGCSMGLTTGRVFCGVRGGQRRRQYALMGQAVNLAARLMQAADGDILLDTATARAVADRFELQRLQPLQVKGRAEPVPVYRPRAARAPAVRLSGVVGRHRERRQLVDLLAQLPQSPAANLVLLEGEAGIGKSTLLRFAEQAAADRGIAVLRGSETAMGDDSPYAVWRGVFQQLLGAADDPEHGGLRRSLDRLGLADWLPLLSAVLPQQWPENEVTAPLVGAARTEATCRLLARLLRHAAAERPLLLLLDDGQWFDPNSWALIAEVVREPAPILLLIATRPLSESATPTQQALLARAGTLRLALPPISTNDCAALLRDRLRAVELPPGLTEFVHERSGGNPLYAEQLLLGLLDSGHLKASGSGHTLRVAVSELDRLTAPATLEGVVIARLDLLPPSKLLTLKVASALGSSFTVDTLAAVHPVTADPRVIDAQLSQLCWRGLISQEPGAAGRYAFRHGVLQQITYGLLSFDQRRALHRAIATHLESSGAAATSDLATLAQHWAAAGEPLQAAACLERAARQALDRLALEEAVRLLDAAQVYALSPPDSRRARWHYWCAVAAVRLGQLGQASTEIRDALAIVGHPLPTRRLGLIADSVRQGLVRLRRRRNAPLARTAEQQALLCADLHWIRCEAAYFGLDRTTLINSALRTLNFAEPSGPNRAQARAHAVFALSVGILGRHRTARAHFARGKAVAAELNDAVIGGYCHQLEAMYHQGMADWERAETCSDAALRLYTQAGDEPHCAVARAVRGFMHLHRGQPTAVLERAGSTETEHWVERLPQMLLWRAATRLAAGLMLEAIDAEAFERLERLLAQPAFPADQLVGHGVLALAMLRRGDDGEARSHAQAVLTLARERPTTFYGLWGYFGAALCWLELRRRTPGDAELERKVAESCKGLERFARSFPLGRPAAALATGYRHRLDGRYDLATAAAATALDAAEHLRMPYEQALACQLLAELDGDARQQERAQRLLAAVREGTVADGAVAGSPKENSSRPQSAS